MKRQLTAAMELENLRCLVTSAEELQLHCHEFNFYEELCESNATLLYICDDDHDHTHDHGSPPTAILSMVGGLDVADVQHCSDAVGPDTPELDICELDVNNALLLMSTAIDRHARDLHHLNSAERRLRAERQYEADATIAPWHPLPQPTNPVYHDPFTGLPQPLYHDPVTGHPHGGPWPGMG